MSQLISVLVPVYNGRDFIADAVSSILQQTYSDFELIFLIEHGAEPETASYVRGLTDGRIRIIEHDHRLGLPGSLNVGIAEARGKFIARMDADDICRPERFETQVNYFNANPDVAFCGSYCQLFGDESWQFRPATTHESIKVDMLLGCPFVHPSVMFRRQAFLDAGLSYNEDLGATEDYDLWSRTIEKLRVGNVDQILLDYRKHGNAATARHQALGAKIYAGIMERQLSQLVNVSANELGIHHKFFTSGVSDVTEFALARRWFEKLVEANDIKGIYDRSLFRETLAWRLFYAAENIGTAAVYGIISTSSMRPVLDDVRVDGLLTRVLQRMSV